MCGIFGIAGSEGAALKTFFGLYDLQHRGEQSAGIAVSNGKKIRSHKGEGLVTEVLGEQELLAQLSGGLGIGHNRYSTIGDEIEEQSRLFNIQPLEGSFCGQPFFLVHNGNLINIGGLKKETEAKGYQFKTSSDTEVIVALLATSAKSDFLEALLEILPRLEGAFSLLILLKDKVIGIRDGRGIRPLCLGRHESGFILASESCAFNSMGASFARDIKPGEIIILDETGISQQFIWAENQKLNLCVFELIYFARPDSLIDGVSPYFHRLKAGELCARENPVLADLVTPTPESGEIYALGFSRTSGIPLEKAIFKNRYFLGDILSPGKSKKFIRTFLTERGTDRRKIQRHKFYCLRSVVQGKSVTDLEDSLIRGNVSPEIISMLRVQGGSAVHLRVGSPPIRYPCFFGIDIPTRAELVAASLSVEEIRERIQADSLGYLSFKSLIEASGLPRENLCLGCFIGEYPVAPPLE